MAGTAASIGIYPATTSTRSSTGSIRVTLISPNATPLVHNLLDRFGRGGGDPPERGERGLVPAALPVCKFFFTAFTKASTRSAA